MRDGIYVVNERGEEEFIAYDDIDPEVLPKILRPIGGFCYEAGAFVHLPLPKVPYYLKDWLPKQGRLEIYGQPKVGKSYLCMQLARAIGEGESFLGIPTNVGRVLYVQSELGAEVLQSRFRATGKTYSGVYVGTTFSMKLDTKAGQGILTRAMEAVLPSVVILDPLYTMMDGDENEAKDMREVTSFLDDLIEWFSCSVVLIHHAGKDLSKGGRGSNALQAWVDSFVEMRRVSKNGETLRIRLTPKDLRHAELPPEPIEAELQDFEFVPVDSQDTVKGGVLEFLRDSAGVEVSPKVLEEAGIGKHASIAKALKELVEEGIITKVGRGGYLFTTK